MPRRIAWPAACLLFAVDALWAHPGHGVTDPEAAAHYILEPNHALPLLLIAVVIGGVWSVSRRPRKAPIRRNSSLDV